jgi:hypothetical protein
MAIDTPPATPAPQQPRTALLVILGVAVTALVAYWLWPATSSSAGGPSNQQRSPQGQAAQAGGSMAPADVRLDALKNPSPEPSDAQRNPFRFQPKAPPPSGPAGSMTPNGRGSVVQPPSGPPPPPPIPPIPLKFIGTLEGRGPGKVAVFSDNRGTPVYGREGDIILGQYRIVRIGVESVVMEYADGRGRQMIPLRGQ